jgi:predicted phage terminase large subunit-like protein
MTPLTRDALEEFLRSVLETRLEPNAPTILINSRWSTDDIFARIQNSEDGDAWTCVNVEAVCETQPDPIDREPGESLWPERWSAELLQKKRKAVGDFVWESQYMGRPTVEGGRLIPVALLRDYDTLPTPPQPQWDPMALIYESPLDAARPAASWLIRVCGIDTSGVTTTTKSGSWSAWVTCAVDTVTGDIYIIGMERVRNVPFEDLRQRVLTHLVMHDVDLAIIEDASQGGRLAESLRRMCRTPIQLVQPRESKEQRCINVLPLIEGGKVHIRTRAAWRTDAVREWGDFPASAHSDATDAFVYALTYCKTAVARRRDDALWDEQLRQLEAGWMFSR